MVLRLLASLGLLAVVACQNSSYLNAVSYDLTLNFNLDGDTDEFTGGVEIVLDTTDSIGHGIRELTLNGANLTVTKAFVNLPNSRLIDSSNPKIDKTKETITFSTLEELQKSSRYRVIIEYKGKLSKSGLGVFQVQDGNNYYISSNLYPTHARKVYPCLDSPNMRADFSLKVLVHTSEKSISVLSGLKKQPNSDSKGLLVRSFKSIIKIPPYGFFFTVGNYQNPSSSLSSIFIPNSMNPMQLGYNAISAFKTQLVQNINKAAGVSSPKLVVVPGLPVDYVSAVGITALSKSLAMEQDRFSAKVLIDNGVKIMTAAIKTAFGSAISPKSWNDVWVSESVSLYLASAALHQIPRWSDLNLGIKEVQQAALQGSWSEASLPVRPNSEFNIFNYLRDPAVQKGAAILGMLQSLVISDPDFSAFLSMIKDMRGSAMSGDDFLDAYQNYEILNGTLPDGKSLKDVVNPWLQNTGYPAVKVYRKDNDIVATQTRFAFPENKDTKPIAWMIPLYYTMLSQDSNSMEELKWMNSDANNVLPLFQNVYENTTVAVNTKGPGLYRVAYDDYSSKIFQKILTNNINSVPAHLRGTIISDGFAFANTGDLSYSSLLGMLKYITNEDELVPWEAAIKGLHQLHVMLYFTDNQTVSQFENYALDLLRPYYLRNGLGLKDAGFARNIVRGQVIGKLCDYEDLMCRIDTETAFEENILSGNEYKIASSDMVIVLYCNGLRSMTGRNNILEYLRTNYTEDALSDVKKDVFNYLGCVRDDNTIKALLDALVINGQPFTTIPADDMLLAMEAICSRPEHLNLCFKYFTTNANKMVSSFTAEHKARVIRLLGSQGTTSEQLSLIQGCSYGNHSVIDDAVSFAIITIQKRMEFLKKNLDDIRLGLFGYSPSPTTTPTPTSSDAPSPTSNSTVTPTNSTITTPTPHSSASANTLSVILLAIAVVAHFFH